MHVTLYALFPCLPLCNIVAFGSSTIQMTEWVCWWRRFWIQRGTSYKKGYLEEWEQKVDVEQKHCHKLGASFISFRLMSLVSYVMLEQRAYLHPNAKSEVSILFNDVSLRDMSCLWLHLVYSLDSIISGASSSWLTILVCNGWDKGFVCLCLFGLC